MKHFVHINTSTQPKLEIRVILVANATMFSHLLLGFSCGSKHLLLPYIHGIVNLMHFCLMFIMRSSTHTRRPRRKNVHIILRPKQTFVLLPGLELGSKSLLPPKKMNF